jgi:iron complex outermembrane receptor protein
LERIKERCVAKNQQITRGTFMNKHQAGSLTIAAVLLSAGYAGAQDRPAAANAPAAERGQSVDELVVVGTRRAGRTVTDSPVPVDVLSSQDIETIATGDMNNLMRSLVPSFNVARFAGINADGSGFIRPPTLRGLAPDQTLVLINGKRRHRSALVNFSGGGVLAAGSQAVDLAQIPTIALERIEVLRDGASAQYGSDAIAGVINHTLRREAEGFEIRSRYGQHYKGDGKNYQLQANVGLPLGDRGFVNVSGEFLDSGYTSRGGQRIGALAHSLARPDLATADPVQRVGDPKVRAYRMFFNGEVETPERSKLYFFGNYGRSNQAFQFNWRQPDTVTRPAQSGVGAQVYPRTNVFDPIYLDRLPDGAYDANGRTFSFTEIYPRGFTPFFNCHIRDLSGVGGYRASSRAA